MTKIGIIGTGNIGSVLTRRLTQLGHRVWIANSRGPDSLRDLGSETGAMAVAIADLPPSKDIIVVTIPMKNILDLPQDLLQGAPAKAIIIDTCNYFPRRDGCIVAIEEGLPESRWVERHLGRPVIKAFNNIGAVHLADRAMPVDAPGRVALPISGDDAVQKLKVMKLVNAMGFDPVDAGPLDESWRQQPGTPCFTSNLNKESLRVALGVLQF